MGKKLIRFTTAEKELFREILRKERPKATKRGKRTCFAKSVWLEITKLYNDCSVVQTKRNSQQLRDLFYKLIRPAALAKDKGKRSVAGKSRDDPDYQPSTSAMCSINTVNSKAKSSRAGSKRRVQFDTNEGSDCSSTNQMEIDETDPNETVEDTQEENSVFDDEADTRSPNQVETDLNETEGNQEEIPEVIEPVEQPSTYRVSLDRLKRKLNDTILRQKASVMREKNILINAFRNDSAIAAFNLNFAEDIASRKIQHIETIGLMKLAALPDQAQLAEIREDFLI